MWIPINLCERGHGHLGERGAKATSALAREETPSVRAITIGDQSWICADAFVGPNVTIGEGAVVGARAVVCKDVAPWIVVAGNPSTIVAKRELRVEDIK